MLSAASKSKKRPISCSVSSGQVGQRICPEREGKQYRHPKYHPPEAARPVLRRPYPGQPSRPRPQPDHYLSLAQVSDATNACAFALSQGTPLNCMISITWRHCPTFVESDAAALQGRLFHRLGKWLKRRGVAFRATWVRERSRGKGLHSHVLLHLPPQLEEHVKEFLCRSGPFHDDASGRGVDLQVRKGTPDQTFGALKYFLKGMDHRDFVYTDDGTANLGDFLGIQHRGDQGIISVKRQGCTQSISRQARREAGWAEIKDPVSLSYTLNGILKIKQENENAIV